jgi:hypothetical protein
MPEFLGGDRSHKAIERLQFALVAKVEALEEVVNRANG